MFGEYGLFIWLLVAALMFVLESATAQMVSTWFAVGALFAIIPSVLGAQVWVQLLVFLLFSVLFLLFARPFIKNRLMTKKQPTNADMVVGQTGFVLEDIDNIREEGRVSAMGLTWTARSENGEAIPADTQVTVNRIDGVKLIVTSAK